MTILHSGIIFICCLIPNINCLQNCQDEDTGWEKVIGAKPERAIETVLYKNSATGNNGITVPCFDRCRNLNCTAFVIDLARNICYSVQIIGKELIPEFNATFFQKICIKVSFTCKQYRLWQVERTLGAVLKDGYSNLYNQIALRRHECYEKCLLAKVEFRDERTACLLNQSIQQPNFRLLRSYGNVYFPKRIASIGTDSNRFRPGPENTLGAGTSHSN